MCMQSALELQLWAPGREILAQYFGWRHRLHLKASASVPSDSVALIRSMPATAIKLVLTVAHCKGTSSLFKPLSPVPQVTQHGQLLRSVIGISIKLHRSYASAVHPFRVLSSTAPEVQALR